jgi:hypothetical protein
MSSKAKQKSVTHYRHTKKRNELEAPEKFPTPPTGPINMIDAMVEEAVDLVVDCEETDEEFFDGVYK